MTKTSVGYKISKLVRSGTPHKQAVAIALSMKAKGRLGPRGGYKRSKKSRQKKKTKNQKRSSKSKQIISCRKVPRTCNRKKCSIKNKVCKANNRTYKIPRLYSPNQCRNMRKKGFTQRASCAPYK